MKTFFYHIDEYGVKNYHNLPILLTSLVVFFGIIYIAGHLLLAFELPAENENVRNIHDAIWLCYMAASTIGFGDFYPVTLGGRCVVGSMFILGALMLGLIIGLAHNMVMGWLDTNVKNRELRKQLDSLTAHNEQLESFLMKLHQHNESLYDHNVSIEKKLDILMEHVDETTPDLAMRTR